MKKHLLLTVSLLLIFQKISSQPVYERQKNLEIGLLAAGLATIGVSKIVERNAPSALTADQILKLDPAQIHPKLDRRATKNWSHQAKIWSDVLLFSTVAAGGTTVFGKKNEFKTMTLIVAEAYFLTSGLTNLTKNWASRTRPFAYNPDAPLSEKLKRDTRRSFFSGHTSMAATGSFLLAKVLSDNFPDKNWTKIVWGGAATLPALTGWARVRAGKHFPTDVLAGYAVGALVGWGLPELHRRAAKNRFEKRGGHGTTFLLGGTTLFGLTFKF